MANYIPGRSVRCVAVRPTGPPVSLTMGTTSGVEPYFIDHHSRITEREITEEGRRILSKLTHMMRQFNDPIKPTLNIKGHKFG
jgi:hypothetical protein